MERNEAIEEPLRRKKWMCENCQTKMKKYQWNLRKSMTGYTNISFNCVAKQKSLMVETKKKERDEWTVKCLWNVQENTNNLVGQKQFNLTQVYYFNVTHHVSPHPMWESATNSVLKPFWDFLNIIRVCIWKQIHRNPSCYLVLSH